jgi:molecular chaperone GrpE (heat shock protein)
MERRSCVPFPARRPGRADDDARQFSAAKALRIGQNIRSVVSAHASENAAALKALKATEKEFLDNVSVPGVRPLGITFETFNPLGDAGPAARSPRRRRI